MAEKGGVYVLDEPTSGLHLADVEQLLGLLDRLVLDIGAPATRSSRIDDRGVSDQGEFCERREIVAHITAIGPPLIPRVAIFHIYHHRLGV
jgi:hypothetical protein